MGLPRTVIIVNPRSQNGALGKKWAEISPVLRRELGSFAEEWTAGPGDATKLCRQALDSGAERVIAIGGDGTINEVTNGFFNGRENIAPSAALGILPFGTGGDFRKTAHLPTDLAKAARIIAEGNRRFVDVGHLTFTDDRGQAAERVFLNIASFGISGVVDDYVNRGSKRLGGRVSFLMATVRAGISYKNQRVRLVFDEDPKTQREVTIQTVAVANGKFFGGGMQIAPDAELDNGRFDVVAVGDMTLTDMLRSGHRLYKGTHLALEKVSSQRARVVRAEPMEDTPVRLDVDGETPGILPATFRCLPQALSLLSP